MKQNDSCEPDSHPGGQGIPLLWNPNLISAFAKACHWILS
jgi:hypothetical protein